MDRRWRIALLIMCKRQEMYRAGVVGMSVQELLIERDGLLKVAGLVFCESGIEQVVHGGTDSEYAARRIKKEPRSSFGRPGFSLMLAVTYFPADAVSLALQA